MMRLTSPPRRQLTATFTVCSLLGTAFLVPPWRARRRSTPERRHLQSSRKNWFMFGPRMASTMAVRSLPRRKIRPSPSQSSGSMGRV